MTPYPTSSVIIPTLNRTNEVAKFIQSLNRQTLLPKELVIVDASQQSSENAYRTLLDPRVALRYLQTPRGLTIQRNIGIRAATGEIIFFFDDDIVLAPEYIQQTLETFMRPGHADVAVVYGTITNTGDQRPANLLRTFSNGLAWLFTRVFFLQRMGSGKFLPSGMPTFPRLSVHEIETEYMPGGLTAYRRELFADYQFDERLRNYAYMEDDDMGYRISRTYRIIRTPNAKCEHYHAPTNRMREIAAGRMLMVNHHYLFCKNFPQTFGNRLAHTLSLIGYPLLQFTQLNLRRFLGTLIGLLAILLRQDPLLKIPRHP